MSAISWHRRRYILYVVLMPRHAFLLINLCNGILADRLENFGRPPHECRSAALLQHVPLLLIYNCVSGRAKACLTAAFQQEKAFSVSKTGSTLVENYTKETLLQNVMFKTRQIRSLK